MNSLILTAEEARKLRKHGAITLQRRVYYAEPLVYGEMVMIREPWTRLHTPAGSYVDATPRYIRQAEATMEPFCFRYQPGETMPQEAVRCRARISGIGPEGLRLTLVPQPEGATYKVPI